MRQKNSVVAAQNRIMLLKIYKGPLKIDRIQNDKLLGVCKKAYEFIDHVVKTCSKVAQR